MPMAYILYVQHCSSCINHAPYETIHKKVNLAMDFFCFAVVTDGWQAVARLEDSADSAILPRWILWDDSTCARSHLVVN